MTKPHFETPRDLIEYMKEMFLKANDVDEFASDFYQFAFQDIDKAIYLALKNTLCYLASTGSEIDSTTVDTYKEYKAKYDCENES